ncbi:hypothetical protein ACIQXF_15200 [Lysinibacillus sp. NPDC097231]|uniref:hypothetical protein n=1 Tax=Lysinibacillus sp. NPDC097231 TaxID=3364142 RepID=UPI0037FCF0F1
MGDSKLYSTQDIDKLKQRIESYKESLTTLKMGTSIEDYLLLKKDFEGIKTQIAHLEGLTETLEDKPNKQTKGYEEQIKLLSTQIESLNQTIEEMNQEILIVLNKLLTIEDTDAPTPIPKTENTSTFMANSVQRNLRITPIADQSEVPSKQPSYKLLQSLAGKAANLQSNINNDIPSTSHENQRNKPKERNFNQQYFQSVNTHPSQVNNGVYRNTIAETTFHFKNTTTPQEIADNIYDPNTLPPSENNDSTDYNGMNPSNVEETVNYEEPEKINNTVDEINAEITNEPVDTNKSPALKSEEMEVFEASAEEENEIHTEIEEVNKQSDLIEKATEEEHKKARNSSFFNFFRKWS